MPTPVTSASVYTRNPPIRTAPSPPLQACTPSDADSLPHSHPTTVAATTLSSFFLPLKRNGERGERWQMRLLSSPPLRGSFFFSFLSFFGSSSQTISSFGVFFSIRIAGPVFFLFLSTFAYSQWHLPPFSFAFLRLFTGGEREEGGIVFGSLFVLSP